MPNNKSIFTSILLLSLIGCSSDSTTTTNNTAPTAPAVTSNVSAASNGSTVTSTFVGNESFTTDEITTNTNFWIGGADGDEVKVAFDQSYSISEITIRTNNTSSSSSAGVVTSGIRVLLSADDVTYNEIGVSIGSSSCSEQNIGSSRIRCVLSTPTDASFIKVIVTSDFAVTEIYEIETLGS